LKLAPGLLKISGGKLPPLSNGQLILLSVNKAKVGRTVDCGDCLEATQGPSRVGCAVLSKQENPEKDGSRHFWWLLPGYAAYPLFHEVSVPG